MASILIGLLISGMLYRNRSKIAKDTWDQITAVANDNKPNKDDWYAQGQDPMKNFGGSLYGPTYNMALPKWRQRDLGLRPSQVKINYSRDNTTAATLINPECYRYFTDDYKRRVLINQTTNQDQNHWRLDPIWGGIPRAAGAPIMMNSGTRLF